MLYRTNPKNGDKLSILGFGAMRLPSKEDGGIDEDKAIHMVRYAIDNGVNFVDTAWPYHMGESEPFLARALVNGYREKVKLSTKLPTWAVNGREDMDNFLNAQLEKLNTDRIDYYMVHTLTKASWERIKELGVIEFLDSAKADGRIINAGFSYHGTQEDFAPIVDDYDWDFCLIQYNFLDEKVQAGTDGLKYAASKGLGVFIMEPLRGGNLAGKAPEEVMAIWDEAETKRTTVEWALRWVWNQPEVTCVLSGMTEPEHVEENIRIAENGYPNALTEKELGLVKRVASKYSGMLKINCTGCGYCMPCPAKVNIPACFDTYNKLHMFHEEFLRLQYFAILGDIFWTNEPHFASQCTNCGICIDSCPQNIPIPEMLEKVTAEFEGPDNEAKMAMVKSIFKM
ncbi:aldo/keto reductase [Methanococcus vannielii SB]|uniref:Aldo/keto reductase n=1 Tax=Methanococcus vannielii (strain ATCC 35089 / DSM 1224 / JCM 13029 / OCM 148 / SB) TaxID=406327 RepID=A6UNW3_METVS|nr:aldo/keto reductase [Methanococcus vannielii]ABR54185.1 aldo/keto reductase [Methanococcus vannielii SB]